MSVRNERPAGSSGVSPRRTRLRPGLDDGTSIVDVARLAGVSISTVSRTLRGAVNVSAPTRDRVLRAAADLAYVPSPAASRLASGRTGTVGVIVQFDARWFFAECIRGAENELRSAGYDLLLYNVGDPACRQQLFTSMPLRRRVDAVLAIAVSFTVTEAVAMERLGVPVVSVSDPSGRATSSVRVDDAAGVATAVRHLTLLGHRDIVMISGVLDDPIGREATRARQAGFRAGLQEAGLPHGADRIVHEPWGPEGGRRAMERLLSVRPLPTAVVAESDETAFGVLQTLRRVGLSVPGDLSLIGFDDHEFAAASDLTTIRQPVPEQGQLGARMLLELVGGHVPSPRLVVLPTELVVRGTTAPPRQEIVPG